MPTALPGRLNHRKSLPCPSLYLGQGLAQEFGRLLLNTSHEFQLTPQWPGTIMGIVTEYLSR